MARKTNKEFKDDVLSADFTRIKSALLEYAQLNKCDITTAAMEFRKMARSEGGEDIADLIDQAAKSGMKKGYIIVAVLFAIVLAFSIWGVSQCKTSLDRTKVENSPYDGSVWQVEEVLKANLKDRSSYESISWGEVHRVSGGYSVTHTYRAKNSFGGYTVSTVIASLDTLGNVVGIYEP